MEGEEENRGRVLLHEYLHQWVGEGEAAAPTEMCHCKRKRERCCEAGKDALLEGGRGELIEPFTLRESKVGRAAVKDRTHR